MNNVYKRSLNTFNSCDSEFEDSDVVIFSCPMDTTTSYRPGTRFAGSHIRTESIGIEWYSPYQDMDLKNFKTCDIGDLALPIGDVVTSLKIIEETTDDILKNHKKVMMIGGEHLVSLGVIKSLVKKYPDLHIIHFDAHTDLRDEFFGMKLSHATVLRRAHDLLGDGKIFQFGIRSGDSQEFLWAKEHTHLVKYNLDGLNEVLDKLKDKNVYITIDLDILDPAYFPGTGTPEPGGITYKELLEAIMNFKKLNKIVGCDIVELAPLLDSSGISTAVACKTLRELVLLLHSKK